MKTALIVRMDQTGLGEGQTKRLAEMIKPDNLMIINSSSFNNNVQHPEFYKSWIDAGAATIIDGFPSDLQVAGFLRETKSEVVLTCETFYNNNFTHIAKDYNCKTVLIANYEFFDWNNPFYNGMLPDKLAFASPWRIDEVSQYNPIYIPTPISDDQFKKIAKRNLKREGKRRYLFNNGRTAVHDRNGLTSLYDSLKYSRGQFELVIKSQSEDIELYNDKRIKYDFTNQPIEDLYRNFDALILPRRYAGQSLPMNEALLSGLPVIMTDVKPNDYYLPEEWLVKSKKIGVFITRNEIEIFAADPQDLALKLDTIDISREAKCKAIDIGAQFLASNLKKQYKELLTAW